MSSNKIDVYIINLKYRKDRWVLIESHLNETSHILNPIRIEACEGKPGWIYCALSHLKIIKNAKDLNLPFVIVMEDDTIITDENFDMRFSNIIEYLKTNDTWDIFNGNPSNMIKSNWGDSIKIIDKTNLIISYKHGSTSNFIIYRNTVYDKLLNFEGKYLDIIENKNYNDNVKADGTNILAIDVLFNQEGINSITSYPYLTNQRQSYSDITNTIVSNDLCIKEWGEKFILSRFYNDIIPKELQKYNFSNSFLNTKEHFYQKRYSEGVISAQEYLDNAIKYDNAAFNPDYREMAFYKAYCAHLSNQIDIAIPAYQYVLGLSRLENNFKTWSEINLINLLYR
jgi:GR25 family glycosyltransferase involved in LPS biosynthesis